MPCYRGLRDGIDRTFVGAGIVFCDHNDQTGNDQTDQSANEEIGAGNAFTSHSTDFTPANGQRIGNSKTNDGKQARRYQPLIEGTHDGAIDAELDEKCAHD